MTDIKENVGSIFAEVDDRATLELTLEIDLVFRFNADEENSAFFVTDVLASTITDENLDGTVDINSPDVNII